MNEVLVVRIRVIEFERRTLVEGNQHIVRRANQTERTAGTEVTTINAAGMTSEFTKVRTCIPHHSANQSIEFKIETIYLPRPSPHTAIRLLSQSHIISRISTPTQLSYTLTFLIQPYFLLKGMIFIV